MKEILKIWEYTKICDYVGMNQQRIEGTVEMYIN